MDVRGTLQDFQPETNNLIILTIAVIVIYTIYMIGSEASRLTDTAIGGLIGYLGASAKGVSKP